ncbi:MAG: hypothetical protein OHK0046_06660 [Anaerolineae bacterium]
MQNTKRLNFYPAHGLDSYTGYGRMELGIAKGLQEAEVQVLLYPDRKAPMLMVNSSLQLLNAPHVNKTRLWAFNMIETNKVDPAWVQKINQVCERLLVPCPPMIDIYQESGVTVPIDFVPLGIDLFDAPPLDDLHMLTGQERPFNFLTYSYGDVRKGADLAVKAFEDAFAGDPQYRLIIKAREGYENPWLARLRENPQIEIIGGRQSEADWQALMRRAHCFVFSSRGEGWGFPPRELTLMGVPTIATQWLGMWDVDQWGIPLHFSEMTLCSFQDYQANAKDGLWSEPDTTHLVTQMRWVVDHYDAARTIAQQGRDYLLRNFSWHKIGEQIKSLVERYG